MLGSRRQLKRTTLIGVGCAVFLLSLGLVRSEFLQGVLAGRLLILFIGISLVLRSPKFFIVLLLAMAVGLWRGSEYMQQLNAYKKLEDTKVVAKVQAAEDAVYGKGGQLTFKADNIIVNGQSLKGKMQISGYGVNAIYDGDVLQVNGKLRKGYGDAQAAISYAQLEYLSSQPSILTNFRRQFGTGMSSGLPEPLASFAMGLLIGQRANLPEQVKDDLKHVGLTHIIAVSGYNLTVILRFCERLFLRFSKRISLVTGVLLMLGFLVITGGAASIVRASIVSMLSLVAGYYGRSFKPLNLILLAAAITAFANPFFVWSDLGWYLSFLAFAGVIILAPLVIKRLRIDSDKSLLAPMIVETLCAEALTLPLVLHYFGQMTLVGLPANIIVATMTPAAMVFSAIAGFVGMFGAALSGWFSWPATLVLNFMLDSTHLLASLPNIFLKNLDFSLIQMLGAYGLIAFYIWLLNGKITDKKANL